MAKIKGKIVVDVERCKGCEVCIPVCPTDVIEMVDQVNGKGYNYMQQVREDCIGCNNCAMVCPDGVISVYKVKLK
jgi:2-oxoglutarate ferredoxin oxidoreductase subunit delta